MAEASDDRVRSRVEISRSFTIWRENPMARLP